MKTKLLQKIDDEYSNFKSDMLLKDKAFIFDNGYEIVYKQQICDAIENSNISDDAINLLLCKPNALNCLYYAWQRSEITTMGHMSELFSSKAFVEFLI